MITVRSFMHRVLASTAGAMVASAIIAIVATLLLLQVGVGRADAQPAPDARVVASVAARGTVQVTWPRATRALMRGETVRADDFTLADTVIAWRMTSVQPDTTRAIAGWITRRAIVAGEFMRPPSVAPAPVITMGSAVKVLYQDGTVRLTLTGTATNSAALGAPVGVRLDRNRRLDGVAAGPNLVRLR